MLPRHMHARYEENTHAWTNNPASQWDVELCPNACLDQLLLISHRPSHILRGTSGGLNGCLVNSMASACCCCCWCGGSILMGCLQQSLTNLVLLHPAGATSCAATAAASKNAVLMLPPSAADH